jgi:hypothetical protein
LLPYEIDLIYTLGCTEEEYKKFVRFVKENACIRPSDYEHIPDIVAGPITPVAAIFINLAVGVALTAVSALLAPKPDIGAFEERKRVRSARLPNQVGPSRFNQTSAFDSVSALAEYGDIIPIPFGKMGTDSDGTLTGGLVLAPALVWSRCFSEGTQQRFKGLYCTGEYGIAAPTLKGLWLGTTPISALGTREYCVYWKSRAGSNRITTSDRIAGTNIDVDSGDPLELDGITDPFVAPVANAFLDAGFCMAYNPNAKSTFGQYNPIHNGSAFRFNWEVVSLPKSLRSDDEGMREARSLRRKISGDDGDQPLGGQPGTGRAYGRRMGLIRHTPVGGEMTEYQDRTEINVKANDTIVFRINSLDWNDFAASDYVSNDKNIGKSLKQYGHNLKDLTSAADTWRVRADNLLTVGSRWMIGASQWVVISRDASSPKKIWERGYNVNVTLKCVSTTGTAKIGIAGMRASTEPLGGDEGTAKNPTKHCGAAFYNLVQYDVATVRMVRIADTIEVGIKSQVWNRASGLCNFNAIPSPETLKRKDDKEIQLNTPRMDKYFERTSCFSIWVRPIPEWKETDQPLQAWSRIPIIFCVTGNSPVDMYNYVRIRPRNRGRYEFRFIPHSGSDIAIFQGKDTIFWRLNKQVGTTIGEDFETTYGKFRMTIVGDKVAQSAIAINPELVADPNKTISETTTTESKPKSISVEAFVADNLNANFVLVAYMDQALGDAATQAGETKSVNLTFNGGTGRTITVKLTATSTEASSGPKHIELFGNKWSWVGSYSFTIVSSTGSWAANDAAWNTQVLTRTKYSQHYGYKEVAVKLKIDSVTAGTTVTSVSVDEEGRIFEENSQVSDCSHYVELEKSCEQGPEHQIVYVNEAIADDTVAQYEDMSMIGLSIKSSTSLKTVDQLRAWIETGIDVVRLNDDDAVGPSNQFTDLVYYLLTNKKQGVGGLVNSSLIDVESLRTTGTFLRANKIQYNTVLETPQNFREFMASQAPLLLCNFIIKNGKFGMMPALPTNTDGTINTNAVVVEQIFSAGNIIEGSFSLSYLEAAQREPLSISVRYRDAIPYELPSELSSIVSYNTNKYGTTITENYDLTAFCCSKTQALLTARFLLAVRKHVDHTINFKTVPDGLSIGPGSYIRVLTEDTTYSAGNNALVSPNGTITSVSLIPNGTYQAYVYAPGSTEVTTQTITISNGVVTPALDTGTTLISIQNTNYRKGVYQVEQLTLDEDGLVEVAAVAVPTDADGRSKVAVDVMDSSLFEYLD